MARAQQDLSLRLEIDELYTESIRSFRGKIASAGCRSR
jgi:hypothetical protein